MFTIFAYILLLTLENGTLLRLKLVKQKEKLTQKLCIFIN